MSPIKVVRVPSPKVRAATARLAVDLGREVREDRLRRGWRLVDLAERAALSVSFVHDVEAGRISSVDGYVRLAVALGLEPRFTFQPERTRRSVRDADPVHAAMGDVEAAHLRALGYEILLDEPYQHYQYAGRADLLAIAREGRSMLHLENRTRFPDIQSFAGAFNAKRNYLARELAERLSIRGGFARVDHVVVALWSAEILHVVRLREASFRSVCPDPPDRFAAWWSHTVPGGRVSSAGDPRQSLTGVTSSLVLFDPLTGQRSSRRRFVGLDQARTVDPRYRGYAHALDALRAAGLA